MQTAVFAGHRAWLFPRLRSRYGDVFTIRLVPSSRVVVVVSRPEHVRELFATPPAVAHTGESNVALRPIMGDHSVLVLDEDEHLRIRDRLMPAFHGPALRGYAGMVAHLAAAESDRWRPGEPFRLHPRLRDLTLEVILRVVFGVTDRERLAGCGRWWRGSCRCAP